MKTSELSAYKARYKKAKKQSTKNKIGNHAFLNLPAGEFSKFVKWQTNRNTVDNL